MIFDGPNRRIILDVGVTEVNVVDIYSSWKDWVQQADNARYDQAFKVVGGDPIGADNSIPPYFFLTNGWRIRPPEADGTIVLSGALLVEEDVTADPVVPPLGVFRVIVKTVLPVKAEVTKMDRVWSEIRKVKRRLGG